MLSPQVFSRAFSTISVDMRTPNHLTRVLANLFWKHDSGKLHLWIYSLWCTMTSHL
ncbi:hypothetical protein ACP4OV_016994 [Aristida adscensionis]